MSQPASEAPYLPLKEALTPQDSFSTAAAVIPVTPRSVKGKSKPFRVSTASLVAITLGALATLVLSLTHPSWASKAICALVIFFAAAVAFRVLRHRVSPLTIVYAAGVGIAGAVVVLVVLALFKAMDNKNVLWQYRAGAPVTAAAVAGFGVSESLVFVGAGEEGSGHVTALRAGNGSVVWRFETGGPVAAAGTLSADGKVLYQGAMAGVYALDTRSGARLWVLNTSGPVETTPAVAPNGYMFFGSTASKGGAVWCVNSTNGALVWSRNASAPVRSSPVLSLTLHTVYVGCDNQNVTAYAMDSGAMLWMYPAFSPINTTLALNTTANTLFVPSQTMVFALSAATGEMQWALPTPSFQGVTGGTVAGGMLLMGSLTGELYAMEEQSGYTLWSCALPAPATSQPVVDPGAYPLPPLLPFV